MASSANVLSIQALEDLKMALLHFRGEAENVLSSAGQEIQRTLEWLAERERYWAAEVRRRQESLARAMAALAACQRSGSYDSRGNYHAPNCSVHELAVRQAQQQLREAQAELHNVQQWVLQVQQVAADYQRQARRLAAMLDSDLPRATAFLEGKIATLESYLTTGPPSSGPVPSSAYSFSHLEPAPIASVGVETSPNSVPVMDGRTERLAGIPSQAPAWTDQGVQEVPLSEITLDDSPIHSPADFHKVPEAEMREGLRKLAEVVRVAVVAGQEADYFELLDECQGLEYAEGYRRIYDAFYGDDAIRLNKVADRYEVVNGYHRLTLARAMGWETVPARVIAQDPSTQDAPSTPSNERPSGHPASG